MLMYHDDVRTLYIYQGNEYGCLRFFNKTAYATSTSCDVAFYIFINVSSIGEIFDVKKNMVVLGL